MSIEAPNSEVDICNLALDLLKQAAIVQLDPPETMSEQLCARWYQAVRRSCLRKHTWNFAIKRAELTPDSTATPAFEFSHAYNLPSDFIRFLGFYTDLGITVTPEQYAIENNQLLYDGEDSTAINIKYIFDQDQVVRFDSLFVDLFAVNLAIKIGPRFVGSETRIKTLIELEEAILIEAKSIDGQEHPPVRVQVSKAISARRGLGVSGIAGRYTNFS